MTTERIIVACLMAVAAIRPSASQSTEAPTPPHRRHHALTYDPATKRVLLHGGQHLVSNSEAPVLNDLWSWDGSRWTQLSASVGMGMIAQAFADGDGGVFITANAPGLTARWGWTTMDHVVVAWRRAWRKWRRRVRFASQAVRAVRRPRWWPLAYEARRGAPLQGDVRTVVKPQLAPQRGSRV